GSAGRPDETRTRHGRGRLAPGAWLMTFRRRSLSRHPSAHMTLKPAYALFALLISLLVSIPARPASALASTGDSTSTGRAPASDTVQLRRAIEEISSSFGGVVGVSVHDLTTGETLSLRGDETFSSASLIKVAILVTLMDEVNQGRMRLDERSTLIARDRVGGSGILKHMSSGTSLTLEDLAWLMITLSDNTATNLLLDKLDIRTV